MTIRPMTECPNPLNGVYNPTEEQKLAAGYRHVPPEPPLAEGYQRVSRTLVEGDGVTGAWEVVDRLAADIEAERQAAKPAALKAVEVRFLDFCQQLTGERRKAGFAELRGIIEAMAANPETVAQALVIAAQLTAINDEGFREGGLQWWDDCADHLQEGG